MDEYSEKRCWDDEVGKQPHLRTWSAKEQESLEVPPKEKRQPRKGGPMPQSTEAGRQCGTTQRKEEQEVEQTD